MLIAQLQAAESWPSRDWKGTEEEKSRVLDAKNALLVLAASEHAEWERLEGLKLNGLGNGWWSWMVPTGRRCPSWNSAQAGRHGGMENGCDWMLGTLLVDGRCCQLARGGSERRWGSESSDGFLSMGRFLSLTRRLLLPVACAGDGSDDLEVASHSVSSKLPARGKHSALVPQWFKSSTFHNSS